MLVDNLVLVLRTSVVVDSFVPLHTATRQIPCSVVYIVCYIVSVWKKILSYTNLLNNKDGIKCIARLRLRAHNLNV